MENAARRYATFQTGQTCWFHSILNGFLLNRVGRVYLRRALFNFKRQLTGPALREFESNSGRNSGMCPGSLVNSRSFFRKIQTSLYGGTATRYNFTNVGNLLSVQNSPQDPSLKIGDFMTAIGMHDYTTYYNDSVPTTLASSGETYIHIEYPGMITRNLVTPKIRNRTRNYSFVVIALSASHGGTHSSHAITGLYDDSGNEYILDSNRYMRKLNFEDILTDPQYTAWCIHTYGFKFDSMGYSLRFYIERDALPTRNVFAIAGKRTRNANMALRRNKANNRPAKRRRT